MSNRPMPDFNQLFQDVIARDLCVRCGVCIGVCPVQAIGFGENGFPKLTGNCIECDLCNACCPGGDVDFPSLSKHVFGVEYDPLNLQGFVENMYVTHSTNNKVRDAGTSGGVVTALLLFLLKTKKIDGAIVVGMDAEKPYLSKGFLATTPEEIIAAAKSKYQITPSMEVLQLLRKSEGRFAVVGLPCQIHGLKKMEKADPKLYDKIYCILGLFCNRTLERDAVIDTIETQGINLTDVARFDYRGGNWPGGFQITKKDGVINRLFSIEIKTTINVMFRIYGAKRCYLCIDALAEFADLSFGDFWAGDYSGKLSEMKQSTLVYQRTPKGAMMLKDVAENGALNLIKLSEDHNSKRIMNMARGKKQKAAALLWQKAKQGKPVPDYHFKIKEPSALAKRSLTRLRFYSWMRKKQLRKFALRILFSPLGNVFDYLNNQRKKRQRST